MDDVLEAGKDVLGGSQTASGLVRVAAPPDFLDVFSIEWVAQFLGRYPKVGLDFVLSDARVDLITEAIDVAFCGGTNQELQSVYRQIASQSFMLVASPGYLASRGRPQTLQALADHDCLTASCRRGLVT